MSPYWFLARQPLSPLCERTAEQLKAHLQATIGRASRSRCVHDENRNRFSLIWAAMSPDCDELWTILHAFSHRSSGLAMLRKREATKKLFKVHSVNCRARDNVIYSLVSISSNCWSVRVTFVFVESTVMPLKRSFTPLSTPVGTSTVWYLAKRREDVSLQTFRTRLLPVEGRKWAFTAKFTDEIRARERDDLYERKNYTRDDATRWW